jgi:hypothetical protein
MSKKQATIETSVFGAEFVAMKHGIETLRGLRYKIRMMGIPLTGPSYIYGDNKSQVTNSSRLRYKVRMMGIPLTGPSYIYGDNKSQVTNSS